MELALNERYDTEYIPTISLVTILVADFAYIIARGLSTPTLTVDILRTEHVFVNAILSRETVTVFLYATGLIG